jgi:hypothetical protein
MSALDPKRTLADPPNERSLGEDGPFQNAGLSGYDAVSRASEEAMRRREFITLVVGAAAWPFTARAQQGVRRIGVLMGYAESDPETKLRIAAFRAGLAKRGWSEGHNIQIDFRFSAATASQQTTLAKELLALQAANDDCDVAARHLRHRHGVAG